MPFSYDLFRSRQMYSKKHLLQKKTVFNRLNLTFCRCFDATTAVCYFCKHYILQNKNHYLWGGIEFVSTLLYIQNKTDGFKNNTKKNIIDH